MISKRFGKKRPGCKVDFTLPADLAAVAKTAYLVGDFNDWNETATPMKKGRGPVFRVTLELDINREYAFRYLVNGSWHSEPEADRFVSNPFGGDNSIVTTYPPDVQE